MFSLYIVGGGGSSWERWSTLGLSWEVLRMLQLPAQEVMSPVSAECALQLRHLPAPCVSLMCSHHWISSLRFDEVYASADEEYSITVPLINLPTHLMQLQCVSVVPGATADLLNYIALAWHPTPLPTIGFHLDWLSLHCTHATAVLESSC